MAHAFGGANNMHPQSGGGTNGKDPSSEKRNNNSNGVVKGKECTYDTVNVTLNSPNEFVCSY